MKFKLEKKQINDILKLSNAVINENSLNPVLTCLLVQTDNNNNQIHFIFANERVSIRQTIDNILIDENFSFCVKAKIFNGIVSKLDANEINFEKVDSTLRIITNEFESNINLTDVMLFPEIYFDEYKLHNEILNLDNKTLNHIYKATSVTIAPVVDQMSNMILSGIHFESKEDKIAIVSTDSFRAAYMLIDNLNPNNHFEFVIEPIVLKYVIDNAKDERISVLSNNQSIFFKWGSTILWAKMNLVGNYPNIYNHFNKELETHLSIKNQSLLNMLEHGATLVQSEKTPSAKIIIDHEKVEIRYQSIDFGSSYEWTKWESFNGININFLINIKLLISILKIYENDDILEIKLSPYSPIIINKKDENNLKHLILPLRA